MKLLIIIGPTATGKTDLAIHLAQKYHGEIVSADSRHVYQGMDIGTGKDIDEKSKLKTLPPQRDPESGGKNSKLQKNKKFSIGYRSKEGIPIWLVDIVPPDYQFNLGEYFKIAQQIIKDIWERKKLPIVVGGTGLYIKALLKPLTLIAIPPDDNLRKQLNKLSLDELAGKLKKINPQKWNQMNFSDRHNPRRIVRAIEITKSTKKSFSYTPFSNWLLIYLTALNNYLYLKIDRRVDERLSKGIIREIENLFKKGYHFNLPSFSATPYHLFKPYFEDGKDEETLKNIISEWKNTEHRLARKQAVWFKKMIRDFPPEKILISDIGNRGYLRQIEERINKWYTEN